MALERIRNQNYLRIMHIGLIREEKKPYDKRVALTPKQCEELLKSNADLKISVQPSPHRCYPDIEYQVAGCTLSESMESCSILLGIKEVPASFLIANKTYAYFSHTIKKQPYNREMLQEIIRKKIQLIDYECLTWESGNRIIGFGRFAGIVGTHNGLLTYGKKTGKYSIKPAIECFDYKEMLSEYRNTSIPPIKIALCGDGRVAHGSLELLNHLKIREVTSRAFIHEQFDEPVYVHLRTDQLYENRNNSPFDKAYFYRNPENYFSTFPQYYPVTDLLINAIYWNESIPRHFELDEMEKADFYIKVIADITCDINGSVPSTIRATPIENPVYGWDPFLNQETEPYLKNTIDMMTVSNLPCELARDASLEFGELFGKYILPCLQGQDQEKVIERATIAQHGALKGKYTYLQNYLDGKE